ncbi:MAG: XRE family transcriptional regulator [Pseudomonadota bacterium]|nr:XRE family transcriptional regulator [Pseudomonadota bacterium]
MKKNKSVFHDMGFSEQESLTLTVKADIYGKILDVVEKQKIKPRDLEKILDVPQPRVSELLRGKMSSLSIEKLLSYLEKMGVQTSVSFKTKRAS